MTSAIQGVDVSDVRKGMNQLREAWANHSPSAPICPSQPIMQIFSPEEHDQSMSSDMTEPTILTLEGFCFKFVMGQHYKRFIKSKGSLPEKVKTRPITTNVAPLTTLENYIFPNKKESTLKKQKLMDEKPSHIFENLSDHSLASLSNPEQEKIMSKTDPKTLEFLLQTPDAMFCMTETL